MFSKERINELFLEIQKKGEVFVKELSIKFDISEDSIRKDLKFLEKEGLILRTYGGAKLKRNYSYYKSLGSRIDENIPQKEIIAEKAFSIINDGDSIFLDTSTINILLAELISRSSKKLVIITNMIDIFNLFENSKNSSQLIGIGGIYRPEQHGFTGSKTIEEIKKYNVDKSFVGTGGINVYTGNISTLTTDDGLTKSAIIDISNETYIITENIKLQKDSFFNFSNLSKIKGCIFNTLEDEIILEKLKNYDLIIM